PYVMLETLLQWATSNGAMALSFDDTLGSFEAGKKPGVNLIEGVDVEGKKLTSGSSILKLQ
ncbi:MAG: amidohydrolase family protein, partial [Bacteroidetes bacterium]|nr:amidohydrolase family protein [Bacteroidota bacterium]